MRIFNLVVVLSSVLLLAACGFKNNQPELTKGGSEFTKSVSKDASEFARNVSKDVSEFVTDVAGTMPSGYYGQNSEPVSKPFSVVVEEPVESVKKNVWNTIDHYNAKDPMLSAEHLVAMPPQEHPVVLSPEPISEPVKYDNSVVIYPVNWNKDISPQPNYMDVGREMVQQMFFEHGSSRISKVDSENLRGLATSLVQIAKYHQLFVIGHASTRIDNVTDPVKKKIINLEMARKRANAVRRELNKAGVKPDWILVTSSGDKEPNPNPGGKSQEAADRRVEIYMDDTGGGVGVP